MAILSRMRAAVHHFAHFHLLLNPLALSQLHTQIKMASALMASTFAGASLRSAVPTGKVQPPSFCLPPERLTLDTWPRCFACLWDSL